MGRRSRRVAVAVATACVTSALALAAAPLAQAGTEICTLPDCAGSAEFEAYGEHFYVHDYKRDSHGVVGYLWMWNNQNWVRLTPAGGLYNGNGYAGPPAHMNFSLREGTWVKYEACLQDGSSGQPYQCSGWVEQQA